MKTYLFMIGLLVAGLFAGCEKPEAQPVAEPQVAAIGDAWLMFSLRPADGPSPDNVLLKGMSREIPPLRLDADTLFGIQPNCLNVPSRFESGLPQAESLISFRRVKRRNVSSSLWFHTLVATAPSVSETSSLTVIHFMSGNTWSYRRLVAYGFLGLSERE